MKQTTQRNDSLRAALLDIATPFRAVGPVAPVAPFDSLGFIMTAEGGELTQEIFDRDAQKFVDSMVWTHLQGSWGRTVMSWITQGLVSDPR